MSKKTISNGTLCLISVKNLKYTEHGFSALGSAPGDNGVIFEKIRTSSYPSSNDFMGKSTSVADGDKVMVIRYVGRPSKISHKPRWFKYDVYEIFVKGAVRQIFRQNLSIITDNQLIVSQPDTNV